MGDHLSSIAPVEYNGSYQRALECAAPAQPTGNGFTVALERTLRERGVSQDSNVWHAFEKLKAAANETNPLYNYISRRFNQGRGLTRPELQIACCYPLFRSIPTLREIVAVQDLLVRSNLREAAQLLSDNIADELGGIQKDAKPQSFVDRILSGRSKPTGYKTKGHEEWLYANLEEFARALNFAYLPPQSYSLMLQYLEYEDEHGKPPIGKTIYDLGRKSSTYLINGIADNPEMNMKVTASYLDYWLPFIPTTAHRYNQRIQRVTAEEAKHPGSLEHICAATVRLAIRESSNVTQTSKEQNTGVAGILRKIMSNYRGYFTQKEFKRITGWADAHIDENHGVEQAHEEQATVIALEKGVIPLLELDPDKLAAVFLQEAKHCQVRTAQATSFVDLMEKSHSHRWTKEELDLWKTADEVPIKPLRFFGEPYETFEEQMIRHQRSDLFYRLAKPLHR